MFNSEFTFNTSVGYSSNGNVQSVNDNQLNRLMNKDESEVYKKNISFSFYKLIIIKKDKLGIGDVIDFITKVSGIKWLIVKITKGNCGCEQRRKFLNKWLTIPYFYIKIENTLLEEPTVITPDINLKKNYKNRVTINPPASLPKKGCGCGRKKN